MFTLFTTAKPFVGQNELHQRNTLKSWTLLGPEVEVILFGDEEGAAEACAELGVRHEAYVERNEAGLKRIDYYFERAEEIGRGEVLCYVNCDIILTRDFVGAVERVKQRQKEFLMVGRRWDAEIGEEIDFGEAGWGEKIWQRAVRANRQRDKKWIDYFAFSRGLFRKKIPGFVVGRTSWDNWLVWQAAHSGAAVVDASEAVRAVHQNHDYGYHPKGQEGVWKDEQAQRNFALAGGWKKLWWIADAGWVLQADGRLRRNRMRWVQDWVRWRQSVARMAVYDVWLPSWHFVLGVTRPVRRGLGIRSKKAR